MPKFKNIRIKMKNGKSRLQRVQVLASGKYKFVKNKKSSASKSKSKKSKSRRKRRSNPGKSSKGGKMAKKGLFGNLSGVGFIEDVAIGYVGGGFFSGMGEARLPFTRVVQGIAGHALNRRGKARLVYGISDLIDVYLMQGAGLDKIADEIMQSLKMR